LTEYKSTIYANTAETYVYVGVAVHGYYQSMSFSIPCTYLTTTIPCQRNWDWSYFSPR